MRTHFDAVTQSMLLGGFTNNAETVVVRTSLTAATPVQQLDPPMLVVRLAARTKNAETIVVHTRLTAATPVQQLVLSSG